MSVALLLVTHGHLGREMVKRTEANLGPMPQPVSYVPVHPDDDPDRLADQVAEALGRLDQGDGVLLISDLYGSTPGNIAQRFAGDSRVHVIHGLSLAMLIRAQNYPDLDRETLVERLLDGARRGIVDGGSGA